MALPNLKSLSLSGPVELAHKGAAGTQVAMACFLLVYGMLLSDAGLSWLVVSAGTKLVLMAWLLRWQQDVATRQWSMVHEQLGLRPPPGRWGVVYFSEA